MNNSAGTLSFNRDAQTRRVTGVNLSVQQAFPQVDDLRYTYDPAGNLTRIVNVQGHPQNGAPTRTECFSYDPLDRLSQAWTATDNCAAVPSTATVGGPTPYWTSWTFDQIGLRKTQVQHALPGASGGDTTTSYTYPASGAGAVRPHALSSTSTTGPAGTSSTGYGYNPVGDTTTRTLPTGNQTLTWTEHNRLASVTTPTGTTSYVYDADGTQLIRRDPTSTTLYLPTEEITRDHATGVLTGTRYYTHNGTLVALRVGGANISYLQADQHGTTHVAVKAEAIDNHTVTRRTFDPYGNPLGPVAGGPWPDAHGFLNKPHNPTTNLTDIGARTYDPTTGRFISVDPILDDADPRQWNAYGYAGGNPVTLSDPSGLKYFVDDNNASIPRVQGAMTPSRPGGLSVADRAGQRAGANAALNARFARQAAADAAARSALERVRSGEDPNRVACSLSPKCAFEHEGRPGGTVAVPQSLDPDLWFLVDYKNTIEEAAERFGIDKLVLTALLIQEGSGRAKWDPFVRIAEDFGEVLGRNKTIGIAQMRPDVAASLLEKYYGQRFTSAAGARDALAFDDRIAIKLAAARMHDDKVTYGLTDAQTYVSYSASPAGIKSWLSRTDEARGRVPLMFAREESLAGRLGQARTLW